ncbi:hypothetical protein AQUCO_03300056v1 [Aquilegia coerulea]|uniref:Dof zinc finger protein n=1 Tax=Aquilegia coerulea TaxID=218851 RepID=A0A2G5CZA0_AQUCA|nr:hypothetical protein AQUCO_03300056v1 [Aquilegia coerulea]
MASSGRVMEKPVHQEQVPLKCPRCDSSNTKFCYYNNYSLSQPRHFCKACKRYWTRGGTLRNVPVGGGYRKNKKVKKSGGTAGSDGSPSISSYTHTPLPHQMDMSTTSHINQLLYGLPNNPSFTNFPFQRFNSRNSSNGETLPTYNNHQSQLSALGLNFPSSSTTMNREEHDYGGAGFNHTNQIQDLLTSSNSILSNLSLLGSASSSYATNASLIASSLQKQKQVWNNGFKETRPNSNFQALLPFENLQMGGGNGDASIVMDMVKMEEGKDRNANRMEWRVPNENHMEPIGSSDSPLYWNSASSVGGWPDLTNYGSSVTPLI